MNLVLALVLDYSKNHWGTRLVYDGSLQEKSYAQTGIIPMFPKCVLKKIPASGLVCKICILMVKR